MSLHALNILRTHIVLKKPGESFLCFLSSSLSISSNALDELDVFDLFMRDRYFMVLASFYGTAQENMRI